MWDHSDDDASRKGLPQRYALREIEVTGHQLWKNAMLCNITYSGWRGIGTFGMDWPHLLFFFTL